MKLFILKQVSCNALYGISSFQSVQQSWTLFFIICGLDIKISGVAILYISTFGMPKIKHTFIQKPPFKTYSQIS